MKLLTKLTAFFFLSFFFFCTLQSQAQSTRPAKGKLFLNQPRPRGYYRDPTHHPTKQHPVYRSYDGTNNNLLNAQTYDWGSADIPLYRELPASYGSADPKNALAGSTRPSARKISNSVSDEPVTTFNARGVSTFFYVWGQFIDHDISLTPTDTIEYVPIELPSDETVFTVSIPFFRSEVRKGTGVTSPREQTNLNTSWIDGSQVYGSDSIRARWLRTGKNGKMKTSSGNLLPYNTVNGELSGSIDPTAPSMANDSNKTVKTFAAGDVRASEHPGLISMHTLFVREHNRICDMLVAQGLRNDEEIYQRARKQVGAEIQTITYQEFLPAFGVNLPAFRGYNPLVKPDIANTFATAAYRFGHSVVADDIILLANNCDSVPPNVIELIDAFWNPALFVQYKTDPFLKGLAAHTQYETDTKINSVLRNFLFVNPNNPVRFGIDLAALNIQRGRDHGLPDYNTLRRFYTGKPAKTFSDITKDTALAAKLASLYGNVNNIDAWVGVLAEDHLPNASAGATLAEMLKAQFGRLRDGDYYFYLNDPNLNASVISQVRNTKLSDIIKRNTTIKNIQSNVFFEQLCSPDPVANSGGQDSTVTPVSPAMTLFPNPATTMLSVQLNTPVASGAIRIYNSNGNLLKSIPFSAKQPLIQVNISDLKPGTYVLTLVSPQTTLSQKFIKLAN